ncbi:MAG: GNAT family N-acetyltransferase [Saccharospirillaceae bacterium]|nr:GNAT family N-acetyltransferase [Pseudomonadales bacterium]NRB77954.1 GNAT family N-acetyltransferase [Saccharospirillaceae bacterium]
MNVIFRQATSEDALIIAQMVLKLTDEICEITKIQHFNIDLNETKQQCETLLSRGFYSAILGFEGNTAICVVTLAQTHALYAGGKVGLIQEFYVSPEHRSTGVGSKLVEQVRKHGLQQNWACIELCTPPLPEFKRALEFYQKNGLKPVGGRKMRQSLK